MEDKIIFEDENDEDILDFIDYPEDEDDVL